jgi:hypothetical protein
MAEAAEDVRELETQRLDAMLFALRTKIKQGDVRAIDTAIRIADRRAKLLGLDAPTRNELCGHNGGPIAIEDARERLLLALARFSAEPDDGTDPSGPCDPTE